MSVRVAIAGSGGRMGRALQDAAKVTEGILLASAFDIGEDVKKALAQADVLIDFTRPEGTLAHLAACRELGRSIVIGTTGFSPAQVEAVRDAARAIPIVMAPNMSIGVSVALKLVDLAARALGPDYDVEVFEIHHKLKVDAPSGTALKLGEVAAAARGTTIEKGGVFARHGTTGERKAGTIGFSAARGGDIVGDHTVFFAGPGERVEITHRSSSRATYAQGALRAARFLQGKAPGLYDMDDVLGLR
jgi:4-hydroxy-tetrahydrodipicolinate reductase